MDFDPSAFLSMAMTEDQDAEYTAPEVPPGFSPVKIQTENIVVEGGLQMENDVQIPVPMFGLLQESESEDIEKEVKENEVAGVEVPMHIDIADNESNTPQASPGERTSSPCHRKIIHATHDETRFRKELFCGHYERVKIFRLHCSICDKHLGCAPWFTERQMRTHKLLSVVVCRKCFEFYGDINFPIEDGSELFCCWCGQGGECFCCSTCPKIVCKKCVKQNFGAAKVKEIDENDDWSCFVCKPVDIWPHRAIMWGLQRWGKSMRQLVAMLPKEEKQAKLSLDTSQCCLKTNQEITSVGLPPKAVLSRIPLGMIATPYKDGVKEVLARQETYLLDPVNGLFTPCNQQSYAPMNNFPRMMPEKVTRIPGSLTQAIQQQPPQVQRTMVSQQTQAIQQQPPQVQRTMVSQQPRGIVGYHVRQQVVNQNMIVMNRPGPYPMNRNMPSILQPSQHPQYLSRIPTYLAQPPYRMLPPVSMSTPSRPTEFIDLEKESALHSIKPPLMDISLLENGVKDVRKILQPTLSMLDQFSVIKNELANDFAKLTSYSDKLSYSIKIAICNLAKANTDLVESQKKIIDNRVSSVVNNIQSAVVNGTFSIENQNGFSPTGSNPHTITDSSPEIIEVNRNSSSKTRELNTNVKHSTPSTPLSSAGEEVEDVAIAMLCETVLEVGENKENKDEANKDQATPVKERRQVINNPVKGKPRAKINRKRPLDKNESSEIQIIDLSDDEEETKGKFDESLWCKRHKIVPCKVVLERVEILKVDVV